MYDWVDVACIVKAFWVLSKSRKVLFTYQSGERGGGGMLYILGII